MPQQALGRHHHQRFSPRPENLSPQHMEILRGSRGDDDLDIVLGSQREKAFEAGAGMFRPHAFKSMRQKQRDTAQPTPFVFGSSDKLIQDRLRHVGEIAKLSFPRDKTIGIVEVVLLT